MTFVGKPVKRFEDPRLLTGQGSYVDDLKLPNLLHAVVLRSLHAHADIRSIDVSAASRVPGVVAPWSSSARSTICQAQPAMVIKMAYFVVLLVGSYVVKSQTVGSRF